MQEQKANSSKLISLLPIIALLVFSSYFVIESYLNYKSAETSDVILTPKGLFQAAKSMAEQALVVEKNILNTLSISLIMLFISVTIALLLYKSSKKTIKLKQDRKKSSKLINIMPITTLLTFNTYFIIASYLNYKSTEASDAVLASIGLHQAAENMAQQAIVVEKNLSETFSISLGILFLSIIIVLISYKSSKIELED